MPSSDYATAGGGLKLKGTPGSGIEKKKKKKSRPMPVGGERGKTTIRETSTIRNDQEQTADAEGHRDAPSRPEDLRNSGKTETERRHEEMRRKRLDERLKKEGVKTHKQRVEELNKYLSGLSEHHDMPKIGPG